MFKNICILTAIIIIATVSVVLVFQDKRSAGFDEPAFAQESGRRLNPRLLKLPPNQWVEITADKRLGWNRQAHAGIAFDSKRGTILIFGSDTHNANWDNSVHEFDPATETWSTHYPEAPRETYRADAAGRAVCGDTMLLPWAMHTFDNIVYDPHLDAIVVTALPAHNPIKKKVEGVKSHPTWIYRLADHQWQIFENQSGQPSPTFFAAASAYDSERDVIVAYKNSGVWELGPDRNEWLRATKESHHQIHFNMAYDSRNNVNVVFGDFKNTNDVWVYKPGQMAGKKGQWEKRIPTGDACPKDQHFPVAFDADHGVFLIIPDNTVFETDANGKQKRRQPKSASTFIYDYATNQYNKLPGADLPPNKMNYMMVYDTFHKVFLLVTGDWKNPLTVWALKLELEEGSRRGS